MKKLSFILLVWCVCFSAFSQSETEKAILSEIKEIRKENQEIKIQIQELRLENEKRFGEIEKRLFSLENVSNIRFEETNK